MTIVDGRRIASAILVLGILALAVGRASATAFVVLASGVLVGTAYAAYRWPRATLAGVAITTLLDPGVATRFLPPAMADGPIGISEPLLAVTGLVALARIRRAGISKAVREPTLGLVALFVGVAIVSALVNATPAPVALLGILVTVDAMVIFFLWIALEPSPRVNALAVGTVVAAAVVVSLFGIAQVVFTPNLLGFERVASRPEDIGRITSFVGNPNLLAPIIGMVLPFPIHTALRAQRGAHRSIAMCAGIFLVVGLILTVSRGSWISAAMGIVIGSALLDRRALAVAALVVVASIGIVTWMPTHVAYDMAPIPSTRAEPASPAPSPSGPAPVPDPLRGMTSEEVRIYFLRSGLEVVSDHPLLGAGPGRFGGAAAAITSTPLYDEYGITLGRLRTVHSFWLHLAGEVGVAGVTVFLTILAALFIRLCRAVRTATGSDRIVIAGTATSVAIVGINNATEMVLEGNIPAIIVWLLFAAGISLAPADGRPILRRVGSGQ